MMLESLIRILHRSRWPGLPEGLNSATATVPNPLESFFFGKHPRRAALRALAIALIASTMFKAFLQPIRVVGNSMAPTYSTGALNLVNRWAYRSLAPERGDVVAVVSCLDGSVLIKRVLGLPGDQVSMVCGDVYVNGVRVKEPYVQHGHGWCMSPRELRDREYWVIGDNRDISVFTAVHCNDILGKVVF